MICIPLTKVHLDISLMYKVQDICQSDMTVQKATHAKPNTNQRKHHIILVVNEISFVPVLFIPNFGFEFYLS